MNHSIISFYCWWCWRCFIQHSHRSACPLEIATSMLMMFISCCFFGADGDRFELTTLEMVTDLWFDNVCLFSFVVIDDHFELAIIKWASSIFGVTNLRWVSLGPRHWSSSNLKKFMATNLTWSSLAKIKKKHVLKPMPTLNLCEWCTRVWQSPNWFVEIVIKKTYAYTVVIYSGISDKYKTSCSWNNKKFLTTTINELN